MKDITNYTSFKTPAKASRLEIIESIPDIKKLKLNFKDEFIVLGEGCNVLFIKDNYLGTVIINKIENLFVNELDDCAFITAGAGMNWHLFVCQMSESGFYGLENLAYIPGTVGASPVQNIGAYGVEVGQFIDEVITFDIKTNEIVKFSKEQCCFAYRDSFFKREDSKRYIIIASTFKLAKEFNPVLDYDKLSESFENRPISPKSLIDEIIRKRQDKLPNHFELPNAGSFFKNPIISQKLFSKIKSGNPQLPFYELEGSLIKIPAAWLIEKAGYKNRTINGVGTYHKHSLILVNENGVSGKDVYNFAKEIIKEVNQQFNIILEPEVVLC